MGALLSVEYVALVSSCPFLPVRYPYETAMATNCYVAPATHTAGGRKDFAVCTIVDSS